MAVDLDLLMRNYYNTHSQNNASEGITTDNEDNVKDTNNEESVNPPKTYKEVLDGLENISKYEKHDVSTKKSSQYELLKRRAKNRESGIYYIRDNRLFEETVYRDVGTIIKEVNIEEFINNITDEVYRTQYSGDSTVLNTFINSRFREDISYIMGNKMRFDISNPFIFEDTDLRYVGLMQDSISIEVELKDISWVDVTNNVELEFEGIKVYKKGLMENELLCEFDVNKLSGKTFSEYKHWFNSLFILSADAKDTLLDEKRVYENINELLKTSKFNWEEFLGNEYIR